jgi:nucleoside-diphosphate-sugar epimerase
MDYLCHPYKTAKYITTTVVNVDFAKKHAIVVKGTLDDEITYTSVNDIANIVAKAIDFEGEWPVIGGISGDRISIRQLLKIGEELRGKNTSQTNANKCTDFMQESLSLSSGLRWKTLQLGNSRLTITPGFHYHLFLRIRWKLSLRWWSLVL